MKEVQRFSQEAFDRLEKEFEDLTTRGRIEIAIKIEAARELGDLSENGDYHAAKEEQGKMEGRIAQLGALILDAEIIEVDTDSDKVQAGMVITIRYEGDDETEKYLIGSIEEKRDNIPVMSPGSPLGQVLVGASAGDTVTYNMPNGPMNVEIISIDA